MKAGQIEKGMYLSIKGEPFAIVEREFVNPGKGAAFVRCKLKSISTGQVLRETIKTQETVELANVEYKNTQYLYSDDENLHFMTQDTYDQFVIPIKASPSKIYFLQEGEAYQVLQFDGKPLDVIVPPKVVLEVVHAPEALKGDTATSVSKMVECNTGLQVKAPGFIKVGDKILINTETLEYVERAS